MWRLSKYPQVALCGGSAELHRCIAPLVHAVLSFERVPHDANMNIEFVSTHKMRALNCTSRGIHTSTDVLTLNDTIATHILDDNDNDNNINLHSIIFATHMPVAHLHFPEFRHTQMKSEVSEQPESFPKQNKKGNTDSIHFCKGNSECEKVKTEILSLENKLSPFVLCTNSQQSRREQRACALELGNVYMCLDDIYARCQCKPARNLPFQLYIRAALVHGVLHALGYNHETPQQLHEMIKREQWIGSRLSVLSTK